MTKKDKKEHQEIMSNIMQIGLKIIFVSCSACLFVAMCNPNEVVKVIALGFITTIALLLLQRQK